MDIFIFSNVIKVKYSLYVQYTGIKPWWVFIMFL